MALGPDTSVPEASAAHVRRLQRDVEDNRPEVVQREVEEGPTNIQPEVTTRDATTFSRRWRRDAPTFNRR